MTVFHLIKKDLFEVIRAVFDVIPKNFTLNFTGDHGELSTNVAFGIGKTLAIDPLAIALALQIELEKLDYVKVVEVAKPGFINLTLDIAFWHNHLLKIVEGDSLYMLPNVGQGKRINVEYVSVNPTGPMHIGHARLAAYGDILARLLDKCGFEVTKEYYINDYGSQIHDLVQTVWIRYKNIVLNQNEQISQGLYPGEYLIDVAKEISDLYGSALLEQNDWSLIVRSHVLDSMMNIIRQDLNYIGVVHDVFTSETLMHETGKVDAVVKLLESKDLVYKGFIPQPKGYQSLQEDPNVPQLLFRSTKFGDKQDRSLTKGDGSWSYFGAELAYTQDKINRGFESLIMVLGADHIGYVERLKAAVEALSDGNVSCDVRVCQLVKYLEDGIPVSMSKRQGTFVSMRALIEEIGCDAFRFMMITKTNDVPLDIDIKKVQEQSKDNPVFYVNYAYARSRSILRKIEECFASLFNTSVAESYVCYLTTKEEIALIRKLSQWPKILEDSAISREPHRIVSYLQDLSMQFHSLWDLCDERIPYRFIIKDDLPITFARSLLARGTINVIKSAFDVIGIVPMDSM